MERAGEVRAYIKARIAVEDRGHTSPCWVWQLAQIKGYAQGRPPGTPPTVTPLMHRVAYQAFVGEIPEGLHIDHLCRVKTCCNPAHLEPVTLAENSRRAGPYRRKSHCARGHEMTGDNILYSQGRRRCRACDVAWRRAAKKKPAPGSRGERAASDAGLDTHNSGTLSSTFPLDGGL